MMLCVSVLLLTSFLLDHYFRSFEYIDFIYLAPIAAAAFLLSPLETVGAGLLGMIFEFTSKNPPFTNISDIWSGLIVGIFGLVAALAAYYTRQSIDRLSTSRDALESSPLAYAEFKLPGYPLLGNNRAFLRMAARRGSSGQPTTLFNSFPEKVASQLSELMDQAITSRSEVNAKDFHIPGPEGHSSYWNINLVPAAGRSPKSVCLLASDITEAVHRSRSRDAALRISTAVMSSLNLEETIQVVLDSLAYIAQTNAGALFLIEDDQWIGMAGCGTYTDELAQAYRWPYDDLPTGMDAIEAKKALAIEDAAGDPRFSNERVRKFSIRSSLVVPLVSGNRAIGAVWLNQTDGKRQFTEEQVEFATIIGTQGALAIENAAIYENERLMRKSLEAIEAISEVGLASLDLDEVLIELVTRTQDVMQMDAAMIFLADDNREYLEVRAATGSAARTVVGARVGMDNDGLAMRAFREGAPMRIDDLTGRGDSLCLVEEYKSGRHPFSESYGIHSALAVPLRPGGKVAGVLQLGSQRKQAFTAREWGLIQVLADRASMAVQNSLLHDQTRKELTRVTLLRDVAAACAGSHDLREIANIALKAVYEELGCHRASIYYLDRGKNALVNLAFFGHTADVMEQYRESSLDRGTLLARAVLEKRIITHEDVPIKEATEEEAHILRALGVDENRRCSVPIIYKDEVVGGMAMVFPDKRPFTPAMLDMISSIANQLAVAIHGSNIPLEGAGGETQTAPTGENDPVFF